MTALAAVVVLVVAAYLGVLVRRHMATPKELDHGSPWWFKRKDRTQ